MIVYKMINTVNDKFYIGITTRNIKERLRGHRHKSNPYLQNAMRKYGKENFIIEQIDTATSEAELDEKERYYIKKLKPHYNMASGGRDFWHHSDESKRKIGEGNKIAKLGNTYRLGKTFTQESRDKIGESLKGNTNKKGKTGKQKNKFTGERTWLQGDNNPSKRPEVREKLRQAALNRHKRTA